MLFNIRILMELLGVRKQFIMNDNLWFTIHLIYAKVVNPFYANFQKNGARACTSFCMTCCWYWIHDIIIVVLYAWAYRPGLWKWTLAYKSYYNDEVCLNPVSWHIILAQMAFMLPLLTLPSCKNMAKWCVWHHFHVLTFWGCRVWHAVTVLWPIILFYA